MFSHFFVYFDCRIYHSRQTAMTAVPSCAVSLLTLLKESLHPLLLLIFLKFARVSIKAALLNKTLFTGSSQATIVQFPPAKAPPNPVRQRKKKLLCKTGLSPISKKTKTDKNVLPGSEIRILHFRKGVVSGIFTTTDGVYLAASAHVH